MKEKCHFSNKLKLLNRSLHIFFGEVKQIQDKKLFFKELFNQSNVFYNAIETCPEN